ncbi:polyprenyl synthetase family protein [Iodidimonas sp. SYSU 1G8]|uniref:polyprenyl synthetase family protein n=1 Tax=Iodidimonas sp. SYSU 1G8 TaxID=3133967 RepID=UPI0031FEC66B
MVRIPREKREKASALDVLTDLVKDDMRRVNDVIIKRMHSPVALIPQLAGHLIASGGKRLRPMLTLATANLCGYEGDRHIPLAACIEFLHSATLLHDDVVDESRLRRGNETANVLWGNQASVLVGDFLFSRAFQVMTDDGSLDVLRLLSGTSAVLAEGEVLQLTTSNDVDTSEDSYLQVVAAKTAVLFAAACQIGAIVAGRPAAEEEALESFGRNLGIAFQLADDALDYSAKQATLGKSVGDDFREGKITLPVILAYRRSSAEERNFWRRTLETVEQEDGDLDHAIALMTKYDALRDTIERARHYGAMAKDALRLFSPSPTREALTAIVDFSIERAF